MVTIVSFYLSVSCASETAVYAKDLFGVTMYVAGQVEFSRRGLQQLTSLYRNTDKIPTRHLALKTVPGHPSDLVAKFLPSTAG